VRGWLVLVLLAGCRQLLGFENVATGDAVAIEDTPSGPCATLAAACAGDVLQTCTAIGVEPQNTTCVWGCIDEPTAHCGELQPTGGAVISADLVDDPALVDVLLSDDTQLVNTATGEITGVRSPGTGLIDGIDFFVRNNVGIFRVRSLTAGQVFFFGSNAAAVVSSRDIRIEGVVDLKGGCAGVSPGPGGGSGGSGIAGNGPGAGGVGNEGANSNGGGGGGGHGTTASKGGDGLGAIGGSGGAGYGDPEVSILIGGSGGGGGGGAPGARGGGGGGAVQLISSTRIDIATGGGINASGCGGEKPQAGDSLGGGGGGGAGGTIVLEAPVIALAGGLAVNGGAGGGGTPGSSDGQDGQLSLLGATGGANTAEGGAGGRGGASGDRAGDPGVGDTAGGGGGGAVGWIRLLTKSGLVELGVAAFTSPALTDDATTTTQATAAVQ
jgi:hypothetical protein